MKQAPGISEIQYKVIGSTEIHEIPFIKGKAKCIAPVKTTKAGDVVDVKLSFRVVEKDDNAEFIQTFLQNKRQLLVFRVKFHSGYVRIVGNSDFKCIVEMDQTPGETAGDFVGYNFDISWSHPLFL